MNLPIPLGASGWPCRLILALPVLASLIGCGGSGTVSGTVTFRPQNKKVVHGTVMVVGKDGTPRYGPIQKDGTYRVDGVPAGPAKLTVSSPNPSGNAQPGAPAGLTKSGKPLIGASAAGSVPGPSATEPPADWFPIPDKYGDLEKSGLTCTVKSGVTPNDITLD